MGVNKAIITAYGTIILNLQRSLTDELNQFIDEYGSYFEISSEMSDDKRYSVFIYLKSTEEYQSLEKCGMGDFEDELERIVKPIPKISLEEIKAIEKLKQNFDIVEPFFWMQRYFISY